MKVAIVFSVIILLARCCLRPCILRSSTRTRSTASPYCDTGTRSDANSGTFACAPAAECRLSGWRLYFARTRRFVQGIPGTGNDGDG